MRSVVCGGCGGGGQEWCDDDDADDEDGVGTADVGRPDTLIGPPAPLRPRSSFLSLLPAFRPSRVPDYAQHGFSLPPIFWGAETATLPPADTTRLLFLFWFYFCRSCPAADAQLQGSFSAENSLDREWADLCGRRGAGLRGWCIVRYLQSVRRCGSDGKAKELGWLCFFCFGFITKTNIYSIVCAPIFSLQGQRKLFASMRMRMRLLAFES